MEDHFVAIAIVDGVIEKDKEENNSSISYDKDFFDLSF